VFYYGSRPEGLFRSGSLAPRNLTLALGELRVQFHTPAALFPG